LSPVVSINFQSFDGLGTVGFEKGISKDVVTNGDRVDSWTGQRRNQYVFNTIIPSRHYSSPNIQTMESKQKIRLIGAQGIQILLIRSIYDR